MSVSGVSRKTPVTQVFFVVPQAPFIGFGSLQDASIPPSCTLQVHKFSVAVSGASLKTPARQVLLVTPQAPAVEGVPAPPCFGSNDCTSLSLTHALVCIIKVIIKIVLKKVFIKKYLFFFMAISCCISK